MNSTWGNQIIYSLFGESHGSAIGITIHHLPPGITLDLERIRSELDLRKPGRDEFSTPRKESDDFEIISGILDGTTTGAPMTVLIRNENQRSRDYDEIRYKMRPSHSDYSAHVKYKGYNDYRGGGHFSGRLTAPLVVAGEIANQILGKRGIVIESEIVQIGRIKREAIDEKEILTPMMKREILDAKRDRDSVGGTIRVLATGVKPGIGEPFFLSVESVLAGLFYSVPGVKGVTFGLGIKMSESRGSSVNDALVYNDSHIEHITNNNGGINGGITNGMPIEAQIYFKPTPSIGQSQKTIDIKQQASIEYAIKGRHDPCIVPRAMPVVRAMMAIGILELILWDHLGKENNSYD